MRGWRTAPRPSSRAAAASTAPVSGSFHLRRSRQGLNVKLEDPRTPIRRLVDRILLKLKRRRIKRGSILVRFYPELSRFESDQDRWLACQRVHRNIVLNAWFVFSLCSFFLCVVAYGFLVSSLNLHWAYFHGIDLLGIVYFSLTYLFFRPSMRKALRIELLKKGIPICLHCGYNLTGCPSYRCPECGIVTSRSLAEE